MHNPTLKNETEAPEIEQMLDEPAPIEKAGVRPADDVAETTYKLPATTALPGTVEVKVKDCAPLPTLKDCTNCGAALNAAFPFWFAFTMHVPDPMKLTTLPPVTKHTDAADGAIENTTVKPEDAVAGNEKEKKINK